MTRRAAGPPRSLPEGTVPSPNIWHHPDLYELENRAVDRAGLVEAAMRDVRGWTGAAFLDVGCGSGFHLPRWAQDAATVVGVEPYPALLAAARRRVAALPSVRVLAGTAQQLPLPDSSVDVVQARWAYFFGPGCEPGLAEVRRVLRRGGAFFIVDVDAARSTFGGWFRRANPTYDPPAVERFWSLRGFSRTPLDLTWSFDRRADLEACVGIELGAQTAADVLAHHPGRTVDYAATLWWRRA